MKRYHLFPGIILAAAAIFYSCKKEYHIAAPGSVPGNMAYLKIVHASPNFSAKNKKLPDGLNVFFGSTKVNGPLLKYNSAYPAIGSPNTYAAVPAGDQTIKISVGGTITADSLSVISLKETLTVNGLYTLTITDDLDSTGRTGNILTQDNISAPAEGNISLRFVNMVLNAPSTDMPYLYSKRRGTILFPQVQKDSITPFAAFTTISTLDSFYVRLAGVKDSKGNDSTAATLLLTATMLDQGAFTLYFMGNGTSTAAKRVLTYVQNR